MRQDFLLQLKDKRRGGVINRIIQTQQAGKKTGKS